MKALTFHLVIAMLAGAKCDSKPPANTSSTVMIVSFPPTNAM